MAFFVHAATSSPLPTDAARTSYIKIYVLKMKVRKTSVHQRIRVNIY